MISSGITKETMREAEVTPVPYLAVSNVQDQRIVLENVKTIDYFRRDCEVYTRKRRHMLTEGGDPDKLGREPSGKAKSTPAYTKTTFFKSG